MLKPIDCLDGVSVLYLGRAVKKIEIIAEKAVIFTKDSQFIVCQHTPILMKAKE